MKRYTSRDGWGRLVQEYGTLLLGTLITALPYPLFFVPCHIAPGGISGLATILHALLHVPVGLTNIVICVPLFVLSFRRLGRRFFFRSLAAMALSSVFIDILPLPAVTDNILLAAIFGGVLLGIGLGLVVRGQATTGGTDMAAALLHDSFPVISLGGYVFGFDALVILTAAFCFSLDAALVAVIAVFVQSVVLDRVVQGFDTPLACIILSQEHERIAQRVRRELGCTVTMFDACGAEVRTGTKALLCVLKRTQTDALRGIVRETDPAAQCLAADVAEGMGEGFSRQG